MSDALKLADTFDARCWGSGTVEAAAAELRRLHAEVEASVNVIAQLERRMEMLREGNTALREAAQDTLSWLEWFCGSTSEPPFSGRQCLDRLRAALEAK